MIFELDVDEFKKVKGLLCEQPFHPVINGVIDGNNLGRIFVNDKTDISTALIWAKNEMFYLIGNSTNFSFNESIRDLFIKTIKPEAISIGDLYVNLETYPKDEWKDVHSLFKHLLAVGERVPFTFDKSLFLALDHKKLLQIPKGYVLKEIDESVIKSDRENLIKEEILKFWESLEKYFEKGIGYCVLKDDKVIGTCISVFVSNNEYEIGINTYDSIHRGRGLATAMAVKFLWKCIHVAGKPHWTTEKFRKDSIKIARKIGFNQLNNYVVYFVPFEDLK